MVSLFWHLFQYIFLLSQQINETFNIQKNLYRVLVQDYGIMQYTGLSTLFQVIVTYLRNLQYTKIISTYIELP